MFVEVKISSCLKDEARCQPQADAVAHQHVHARGASVGEQVGMVGPGTAEDQHQRAKAVSVPAHMSSGVVASQVASMRINVAALATRTRRCRRR